MHTGAIAGIEAHHVILHVRHGDRQMPAFSSAVLSDGSLEGLASYIQSGLAHPVEPTPIGPESLDPFWVGLFVWGALAILAGALATLFGEARN